MADEIFRQKTAEGFSNGGTGVDVKGNIPPEFNQILNREQEIPAAAQLPKSPASQMKSFENKEMNSNHLRELLETIKNSNTVYEEIQLPSGGRFYDGETGPSNGRLSIRPMTGEEEQILE